jgi:pimeloyl-ACP methyl ester carboxylesterase
VLRSSYIAAFQLPVLPERLLLAAGGLPLRRALRQGGLPAELADHYVARMREPGALTAALNWYRALPWSSREPVHRVPVPATLIWGARDTFLGRTAVDLTERFCRGPYRLEVLPDQSHWLPELAAARVAELVVAQVRSA